MVDIHKEQNELLVKAVRWTRICSTNIEEAGGNPASVLGQLGADAISTLIRNDLYIIHRPEVKKE